MVDIDSQYVIATGGEFVDSCKKVPRTRIRLAYTTVVCETNKRSHCMPGRKTITKVDPEWKLKLEEAPLHVSKKGRALSACSIWCAAAAWLLMKCRVRSRRYTKSRSHKIRSGGVEQGARDEASDSTNSAMALRLLSVRFDTGIASTEPGTIFRGWGLRQASGSCGTASLNRLFRRLVDARCNRLPSRNLSRSC
jgi:hypothetical protein